MSKYSEDEQIEQYIQHKQQPTEETINKEDLLKVFDDNLDKLEEIHIKTLNNLSNYNNLLSNFQMLIDLIELNKIV
jgi:hypothetical protein